MAARKTAPFPPDIRANIAAVVKAHDARPRPEGVGRKIGMPVK
jgi:acyl-CoA thioester hydrolase